MSFKVLVEDRVPTYPGRVTLTPVAGSENTYDLVRADQPIVEGTPINKALFESKSDALTGDVTAYVTTVGSDTEGDGSQGAPFRTIQKAIDALPKDLGGHVATINVAEGTYVEDIEVSGFYGGSLRFAFGTVTIGSFTVYESYVILTGTALTMAVSGKTYGLHVHRGSNVISQLGITINGASNGLYVAYGSRFEGRNPISVNSCTYAVSAMFAAYLYAVSLTGSRNNNAVQASGGILSAGSIAAGMAPNMYATSNGGRIYIGAQATSTIVPASVE